MSFDLKSEYFSLAYLVYVCRADRQSTKLFVIYNLGTQPIRHPDRWIVCRPTSYSSSNSWLFSPWIYMYYLLISHCYLSNIRARSRRGSTGAWRWWCCWWYRVHKGNGSREAGWNCARVAVEIHADVCCGACEVGRRCTAHHRNWSFVIKEHDTIVPTGRWILQRKCVEGNTNHLEYRRILSRKNYIIYMHAIWLALCFRLLSFYTLYLGHDHWYIHNYILSFFTYPEVTP